MRYLFAIVLLLGGCAQIGINPQTPRQRLVVIEYSYQLALKEIAELADRGLLNGDKAGAAIALVQKAGAALEVARNALGSSEEQTALETANSIIADLIEYLQKRRKGVSWTIQPKLLNQSQQFSLQLVMLRRLSMISSMHLIRPRVRAGI